MINKNNPDVLIVDYQDLITPFRKDKMITATVKKLKKRLLNNPRREGKTYIQNKIKKYLEDKVGETGMEGLTGTIDFNNIYGTAMIGAVGSSGAFGGTQDISVSGTTTYEVIEKLITESDITNLQKIYKNFDKIKSLIEQEILIKS